MAKNIGFGSSLSTSTGAIAQVRSISTAGLNANDVDTTTLDTSTNFRTFSPGILDPGTISLDLAYDPGVATHALLQDKFANRTTGSWVLSINGSTAQNETFSAYVNDLGREIPLDELVTATLQLKISGDPGLTT